MNKSVDDSGRLLSDIRREFSDLRREIGNVIAQVGMQTDTQKLMAELDDKILHVVNEHQKSTDGTMAILSEIVARQEVALSHVYYQLAEINRVQSQLNDLGHVAPLIPVGPFCSRLLGEERHARSEVAKHVVQKYFVEPSKKQNCFVQASSLAFDLFRHIDILDGVTNYCLFHVNGPVAALPLQFGHNNGKHCVVPFWGAIFDTSCAAYIPPSSDEKAIEELRKLFQRQKDPLNLVFLSPRYMTPDAQIYYEKLETVHFVDEIADAMKGQGEAEIVVMLPGDRIVPCVDKIPQEFRGFNALHHVLRNQAERLTYVISDTRCSLPSFAANLRQHIGRLWWQDCSQQWHDVGYP